MLEHDSSGNVMQIGFATKVKSHKLKMTTILFLYNY